MLARSKSGDSSDFSVRRNKLVEEIVEDYGLNDKRVIEAMRTVPRHEFVPKPLRDASYDDNPLPIGYGQTISQPLIVAMMAELAEIKEKDVVLEVGSGCGYNAAVLSRLAYKVYSTEIIPELHEMAKQTIERVGYENVVLVKGNGSVGYQEYAPYDVIVVTASAPSIPEVLKEQMAVGGRMVIPVYSPVWGSDKLTKVVRESDTMYREEQVGDVAFVPLTGKEGHKAGTKPSDLFSLTARLLDQGY